jgi:hypothetical protein
MSECNGRWWADEDPVECDREAIVCSECVRALALKWWGGIARHSEAQTCKLCGQGTAVLCGDHAIRAVELQRDMLRSQGVHIGEPPPRLVSYPDDSTL